MQALQALTSSPGIVPVFVMLTLGLVFPVVQGVGLARAGMVGWWYVGVTLLQAALFFALGGEHSLALNLVGLVPLAVVLVTWAGILRRAVPENLTAPAYEPALA